MESANIGAFEMNFTPTTLWRGTLQVRAGRVIGDLLARDRGPVDLAQLYSPVYGGRRGVSRASNLVSLSLSRLSLASLTLSPQPKFSDQ